MSIEFLVTSLVIVISPGTGVLYTLGAGLCRGARGGVLAAFSCTLGIVPHLAAVLLGVAAILHTSAVLFSAVKYAGMAYLLYMAWQCLNDNGIVAISEGKDTRPRSRVIIEGILVNLLNPKLTIFFVAFLPQFIRPDDPNPLMTMSMLSGVFMLMTFIVFCGYGIFAAAMRSHVIGNAGVIKWMQRGFAASFGLLAARLAVTEK